MGKESEKAGVDEGVAMSADGDAIQPLSQELLGEIFKSLDLRYFIDDEGDFGSIFDDNQFYFFFQGVQGEVLTIQARWHKAVAMDDLDELRVALNEWNRDKFWPRAYHRVSDDGQIRVFGDLSVDFEPGVTPNQLEQTLRCVVATSTQLFASLADRFGGQ